MFLCLWKRDVALNWTGPAETEYVFTRPVLYLQRVPEVRLRPGLGKEMARVKEEKVQNGWKKLLRDKCSVTALYVAVMELTGRRYRSALGVTVQIAFAIGYMLQPAMAVFLRDEFDYQLAALAPNLVFPFLIVYARHLSSRWLLPLKRLRKILVLVNHWVDFIHSRLCRHKR